MYSIIFNYSQKSSHIGQNVTWSVSYSLGINQKEDRTNRGCNILSQVTIYLWTTIQPSVN